MTVKIFVEIINPTIPIDISYTGNTQDYDIILTIADIDVISTPLLCSTIPFMHPRRNRVMPVFGTL